MKTSNILNILLAAALVVLAVRLADIKSDSTDRSESPGEQTSSLSAIESIMTRTSIRDYENRPVEDEKIDTILKAAMAAPTAVNKQPWQFIVIKDKNTLKSISDNFKSMKMAEKAPLAVVVCGNLNAALPGEASQYWVQDASAATENLLLAAHSLGLGAVWCGIYPIPDRVELLKEMLDIPDSIVPLNVIPIGYPAESPEPKDKWDSKKIHYEKWD